MIKFPSVASNFPRDGRVNVSSRVKKKKKKKKKAPGVQHQSNVPRSSHIVCKNGARIQTHRRIFRIPIGREEIRLSPSKVIHSSHRLKKLESLIVFRGSTREPDALHGTCLREIDHWSAGGFRACQAVDSRPNERGSVKPLAVWGCRNADCFPSQSTALVLP